MWEYKAVVQRVIDADTLEVQIDLGFKIYTTQSIRVLNLSSPERNTPAGKEAIGFCNKLFDQLTRNVTVKTEYDRSFARYLGHVTLSDGNDYGAVVKAAGYGA